MITLEHKNSLERSLIMMKTVMTITIVNSLMGLSSLTPEMTDITVPLLSLTSMIAIGYTLYQEKTNTSYRHSRIVSREKPNIVEYSIASLAVLSSALQLWLALRHQRDVAIMSLSTMMITMGVQHIMANNSLTKISLQDMIDEYEIEANSVYLEEVDGDLLSFVRKPKVVDVATIEYNIPVGTIIHIHEDVIPLYNKTQFWQDMTWQNNEWYCHFQHQDKTFSTHENTVLTSVIFIYRLAKETGLDLECIIRNLLNQSITFSDDIYARLACQYVMTGHLNLYYSPTDLDPEFDIL